MNVRLRVLIFDDSEEDAQLLVQALRSGGFEPDWVRVGTQSDLRAALREREWDIALCHHTLRRISAGITRTDAKYMFRKAPLDIGGDARVISTVLTLEQIQYPR